MKKTKIKAWAVRRAESEYRDSDVDFDSIHLNVADAHRYVVQLFHDGAYLEREVVPVEVRILGRDKKKDGR